jgi:cytochrome c
MRSAVRRTARAHAITIVRRGGLASLALVAALAVQRASAAGDPAHGAQVYKTCALCHAFEKNGAGPKHAGVVGRIAGTVPDYRYSPALQKSGIVWTDATLDRWLADPQALVPGTKMFLQPRQRAGPRRRDRVSQAEERNPVTVNRDAA